MSQQQANTIILDFGSADSDDIKDLRSGEGKIFKKIAKSIEQLQEAGEIGENVQPVIAIIRKKKSGGGVLG